MKAVDAAPAHCGERPRSSWLSTPVPAWVAQVAEGGGRAYLRSCAEPDLARSLTDLGLFDEDRLCFRPFALGRGAPFFGGPRPLLRLVASDPIGEGAIRLTCVPA